MRYPFAASLLALGVLAGSTLAQTLTTSRVASGLARPVWVGNAPGDDRLFVVEQWTADIHIIENGLPKEPPFLDITSKVLTNSNERGLFSMAFDPDYENNGFFYVFYTRSPDGDQVLERYTATGPDTADAGSGLILLGPVNDTESNHNGGQVAFGPDGKLYVSIGDGGGGNDQHGPIGNGQSGTTLLGKIHRINADGSIPGDNPFISPTDGFLDQIWAYGQRNPWRFTFDALTGDMYIADVGQDAWEEVSFQPGSSAGGENYGWRCMEATHCTGLSGCTCNAPSLELPIHEYALNSGNCAVMGGYVYRGSQIPGLQGTYFFGDHCSARMWSFEYDGVTKTNFTDRTTELQPGLGQTIPDISGFGEDNAGELYVIDHTGEVFKIVEDPYTDLGSALPGLFGNPVLVGEGGLLPDSLNQLRLSNALPNSPAALFVSLTVGSAPFKGGVLKAFPPVVVMPATTTALGLFDLLFTFPTGVPADTVLVFQWGIQDSVAVQDVALSNALQAITP